MSRPPIVPDTTTAGIAVDPRTLERVIPESRRSDGTVRKQVKIRPGFTPQEDVRRFRGTRQAQADATALPKGHIIGWTPPTASTTVTLPQSASAKKNAKRKEKRAAKREEEPSAPAQKVADNWDDDEDEQPVGKAAPAAATKAKEDTGKNGKAETDVLAEELEKLEVR